MWFTLCAHTSLVYLKAEFFLFCIKKKLCPNGYLKPPKRPHKTDDQSEICKKCDIIMSNLSIPCPQKMTPKFSPVSPLTRVLKNNRFLRICLWIQKRLLALITRITALHASLGIWWCNVWRIREVALATEEVKSIDPRGVCQGDLISRHKPLCDGIGKVLK